MKVDTLRFIETLYIPCFLNRYKLILQEFKNKNMRAVATLIKLQAHQCYRLYNIKVNVYDPVVQTELCALWNNHYYDQLENIERRLKLQNELPN